LSRNFDLTPAAALGESVHFNVLGATRRLSTVREVSLAWSSKKMISGITRGTPIADEKLFRDRVCPHRFSMRPRGVAGDEALKPEL
jgi:hypothetical protein